MRSSGQGDVAYGMMRRLESAFGIRLLPGYAPGLVPMRHLWEDLRVIYR